MIKSTTILKVCLLWTFIFLGLSGLHATKTKKNVNTFTSPDFAFPKSVVENARPKLNNALKTGDGVTALQAVMQIVIGENLVSKDNAAKGLALIDSVSARLSEPYSSIALLLEGKLYSDIYSSNAYRFNNRAIPSQPIPEDIMEWSRDIFSNRVCELTGKAFKSVSDAKRLPISTIAEIITNSKEASELGLTVYDFMTIQGIANLQRFSSAGNPEIPFFYGEGKGSKTTERNASALMAEILSNNKLWHEQKGADQAGVAMALYALNYDNGDSRTELEKLVKLYGETPYCGRVILRYASLFSPQEVEEYAKIYKLSEDYIKRYPNSKEAAALKELLKNMSATMVSGSLPSQNLPGKSIKGNVDYRNIKEFYMLAMRLDDSLYGKDVRQANLAGAKVSEVAKISAPASSSVPFYFSTPFSFDSLESGYYAIVASETPDGSKLIKNPGNSSSISTFLVSRLSSFVETDGKLPSDRNQNLYVVEGGNQKPVSGVQVKFTPAWRNNKWNTVVLTTDKDGKVTVPAGSYNVEIKSGKDYVRDYVYEYGSDSKEPSYTSGALFTDLSIYHPGDSVGFSGIIYLRKNMDLSAKRNLKVKVILMNANYQPVDTLDLKTDDFGRINGRFILPSDGLLGNWGLWLADEKNNIAQTYFQVADYKSPTFFVACEGTEGTVKIGETVKIKGLVKSYSGMPIADAQVKFDIVYTPWRGWMYDSNKNATYGGSATSSADGSFLIELPTASLKGTRFELGTYRLNISATNQAGETETAPVLNFSMGEAYSIQPSIPTMVRIEKGQTVKASVGVYDMIGHPVKRSIFYKLLSLPDSVKVAEGKFESGNFPFDFSSLKAGEYLAEFSLEDSFKDVEKSKFIAWSQTDKTPPVETSLWCPETEIIIGNEKIKDGKVEVRIGSSYPDSYIFAEMADSKSVYDRSWLKVNKGIISLPVVAPKGMERTKVILRGMHDLMASQTTVTLIPELQKKSLEITTETFRDLLVPGNRESWKFRFSFDDKVMAALPVMAVMSNKALNALNPFEWRFNPMGELYWNIPGHVSWKGVGYTSWSFRPEKQLNSRLNALSYPDWNSYGYSLYGGYGMSDFRVRGTVKMVATSAGAADVDMAVAYDAGPEPAVYMAKKESLAENGVVMIEEAMDEEKAMTIAGSTATNNDNEVEMREVECPLAFFMPDIITDGEGIATLDFVTPAFNGSWQLQIMGYTPDMRGAVLTKDAVASKPVMVQLNAPRFVRTGDTLYLSGTIYNNSAYAASLNGKIEIFDPLTGMEYAVGELPSTKVDAMSSTLVSLSWKVPGDINFAGIKIIGFSGGNSDGEQTVIPVLPSSIPVLESSTFYLAPGEKTFSMELSEGDNGGTATLSYTDNPIWECVTALPSLLNPDSNNALAQAKALYGNAVASGLVNKYPKLGEALKIFADPENASDSTLVSNLQKNASLKIVTLNNTPWVRNAQSETLRMESLVDYTSPEKGEEAVKESMVALSKLQNSDGGWSWCDGMQSSEWISEQIIRHFAMLNKMGFLPEEGKQAAQKGMTFIDKEIVKEWRKTGTKKYPYSSLLDYLYSRSFFKSPSTSSDFNIIKSKALVEIEKNWKNMDIYQKATAATLLYREGRKASAEAILSSLAQYSSSSKDKGVWFDNLNSGWNGRGKLMTTAQVLEAYSQISPSSSMVDGLRQWLLLSRQTQDWGGGNEAADIIQAILESGSDWTASASAPELYIGDRKIELNRISQLTGSLTYSLTGENGELTIHRSAEGPAWGGIVSQFVAPIKDVTVAKTPQLSIEKNLYVIDNNADGTQALSSSLKTGDRVRVTLTLKCDRDLQYVAVTDSRSAALEPADQLSGYTSSDGLWYYREVRNASTNLFIPFLSKGTHVISYECYVDRNGNYSVGIAEAQSQYAPVISAHSSGKMIKIGD